MKALMLIVSLIGFTGFAFLGFLRIGFCNAKAIKEDDPKLRIYGKSSFLLWLIIMVSFSCLGALAYFATYFGRTDNLNGVFALKGDWIQESAVSFNENATGIIYAYIQNSDSSNEIMYPENVKIQVRHLSDDQLSKTKAEFDEEIKNLLSNLKNSPAELKADAKAQRKAINKQAKENEKELRKLLKEKKAELITALKENKEQRKYALDAVSGPLKETLEQIKVEKKIAKKKWLANQNSNTYTAFSGNREYIVTSKLPDIIKVINISPYGFGSGYFDGTTYLGQKIGSSLSLDWHPSIKMSKAGKIYSIGFVLGILVNCTMFIWLLCIIIHRILILSWRKKWAVMSVDEKVAYITPLYVDTNRKNIINVEELNKECYNWITKFKGKSPDAVLTEFDSQKNSGKVGTFFANIITAGEAGLDKAKKRYNDLINVYKYFEAQYKVSLGNLTVVNTEYNFIRKKAILYMQKIKEIMAELPLKERQAFDKLEDVNFDQGLLGDKALQDVFKSIEKMNANYHKQAEKSFDNSIKAASNMSYDIFKGTNKYLDEQWKKNKGNFSDEDLIFGGIGLVAGLGAEAIGSVTASIGRYFDDISANNEAKTRFAESELKLRQAIEDIEKTNRPKVESLIEREKELNHSLNESMERYIIVFNTVNSYIFPTDDKSKTRETRQKRKKEGGNYFTEDEVLKIMELREFNKFLGTLVDADL